MNEFIKSFGFSMGEEVIIREHIVSQRDFIQENPKLTICSCIREIISCIHLDKEVYDINNKLPLQINLSKSYTI